MYERRYVQTIRSVDLWSVLKVSICFYLCALIVMLVAGVMLWWIASAAGVVDNVENFVGELVEQQGLPLPVVGGAARGARSSASSSCASSP